MDLWFVPDIAGALDGERCDQTKLATKLFDYVWISVAHLIVFDWLNYVNVFVEMVEGEE